MKVEVKSLSCVRLLVTPWTAAHQAPPSVGFAREEYWSGVPLPSHGLVSNAASNSVLLLHRKKNTHNWILIVKKVNFGNINSL